MRSSGSFLSGHSFLKKILFVSMLIILQIPLSAEMGRGETCRGNGVIGNYLPGTWRPFSDDAVWNTPIPKNAKTHPDSRRLITFMNGFRDHIRLVRRYGIPVWVVDASMVKKVKFYSLRIFPTWDKDQNHVSDIGIPITDCMWPEPTEDSHICIIDKNRNVAWEMSSVRRKWDIHHTPSCSTLNVWNLKGRGVGDPFYHGWHWQCRGGRGSGFPLIAGLLRPEEVEVGEIRHALVFTFPKNRRAQDGSDIFLPPACRSDGQYIGKKYPIEGMRLQLDPSLTDADLDAWGLNNYGKILAKALQKYGMFLCDNGGAMILAVQMLAPSKKRNVAAWEKRLPGFYKNIERIPTRAFRVVDTGPPVIKNSRGVSRMKK